MPTASETSMFALSAVDPDSVISHWTISSRRSSRIWEARRRTSRRSLGDVAAHCAWATSAALYASSTSSAEACCMDATTQSSKGLMTVSAFPDRPLRHWPPKNCGSIG